MQNATNATRAILTTGCQNGKTCLTFGGTQFLAATATTGISPTYTMTGVAISTPNTASPNDIFIDTTGSSPQLSFNNFVADNAYIYGGSGVVQLNGVTHNVNHALQALMVQTPGTTNLSVDGSSNTGVISNGGISNGDAVGLGNGAGQFLTGNIYEMGIWAGDKSANFSTMNSNQHTYWNF